MKIKEISLKNFANFTKVDVNLSDEVTYLVGPNGSGKSTIGVKAVWAILKGIAERGGGLKGKKIDFIKKGSSAYGSIRLEDTNGNVYVVSRKFTKDRQELRIDGIPDGVDPQLWINGFFNNFMLNPLEFAKLDPRKQALSLGIDTGEFDEQIHRLKSDLTSLNAQRKVLGTVEDCPAPAKVDTGALMAELSRMNQENSKAEAMDRKKAEYEQEIKSIDEEVAKLLERKKAFKVMLDRWPEPNRHDTTDIEAQLSQAGEINAKYSSWESDQLTLSQIKDVESRIKDNKSNQKDVIAARSSYLRSMDFPFMNMEVSEAGGLLVDGRPLNESHFSTGELIKKIAFLLSSTNPELKYVFIQYYDLLDDENQKQVVEYLTSLGFQLVIEKVGTKCSADNAIILSNHE